MGKETIGWQSLQEQYLLLQEKSNRMAFMILGHTIRIKGLLIISYYPIRDWWGNLNTMTDKTPIMLSLLEGIVIKQR